MSATSLGNALSTATGGIVGEFLSWRALFVLYGVCSFVVVAILFRVKAGGRPDAASIPASAGFERYLAVARLRRAQLLYLTVFLEGIVIYGGFTYLGAFMKDNFGASYLAIGLTLAFYGVGTVLASRYFS